MIAEENGSPNNIELGENLNKEKKNESRDNRIENKIGKR